MATRDDGAFRSDPCKCINRLTLHPNIFIYTSPNKLDDSAYYPWKWHICGPSMFCDFHNHCIWGFYIRERLVAWCSLSSVYIMVDPYILSEFFKLPKFTSHIRHSRTSLSTSRHKRYSFLFLRGGRRHWNVWKYFHKFQFKQFFFADEFFFFIQA